MHKSRFTELQTIGKIAEHESGMSSRAVCRKQDVSAATYYKWRAKFGGMNPEDARTLKALELEDRRLKRPLPEMMLDAAVHML